MKIRQLLNEAGGITAAFAFGRFNPAHQGHIAVWQTVEKSGVKWYIGTNPTTIGPNDPLTFEQKKAWMEEIYPQIQGHIVPEQSVVTLAVKIFNDLGKNEDSTIGYVTDDTDWAWSGKLLNQYNGVEGKHGYYKFAQIVHIPSPRVSSATALRDAARAGDKAAFYHASGTDPKLKVAGKTYFDTVAEACAKYPLPVKKAKAAKESVKGVAEAINPDITNPAFSHQQQIGDYLYVARYWSKGLKISAYHGDKQIGYAELMYHSAPFDDFADPKTTPKRIWLESEWTKVNPKYQRQGIMSTMYAYAKMLGNSVKPSELRSPDAKAAWASWRQAGDAKYLTQSVEEAFGPLPLEKQQIRLGRHTVDIERVGLDKNYISFAWHDSKGQEHYEEVPVGDLGSYDDLIDRIKDEIRYVERQYTDQGVAEGSKEQEYGPEWDEMVKRLGQKAQEGPRKTVWDPEKRVYKTVPVQQKKDAGKGLNEFAPSEGDDQRGYLLNLANDLRDALYVRMDKVAVKDIKTKIEQAGGKVDITFNNDGSFQTVMYHPTYFKQGYLIKLVGSNEPGMSEASLATMRDYFAGDEQARDPYEITKQRLHFDKEANASRVKTRKEFRSEWEYQQWLKQNKLKPVKEELKQNWVQRVMEKKK